jgi:hypothetical protein
LRLCPTASVGFVTLNTITWLDVDDDPVTVTESVPQVLVLDVSQTVMVALPAAVAAAVILLPDIPAETTLGLEMLDI